MIPSNLLTNVYPPERVWTDRDPEFREALARIGRHGFAAAAEHPATAALLDAFGTLGWTVTHDLDAPDGREGRYAFACKDLPEPKSGHECIYRLGSTDTVALTMVLAAALRFEELLALPAVPLPPRSFPNGAGRPIAILALEPQDLAERYVMAFVESRDELDYTRFAYVDLTNRPFAVLLKHLRSPIPGTEIWADAQADWTATISEVLATLQLTEGDLLWRADTHSGHDGG